jgi:hypothetical protein
MDASFSYRRPDRGVVDVAAALPDQGHPSIF